MNLVLDLIILGIIALAVVISAKKGFVKVLIETLGFVAAVILAFTISAPLADLAYDKIIEPPIVSAVADSAGDKAEEEAVNALPDFIANNDSDFLSKTIDDFTRKISQNVSDGTESAVRKASQEVIKPVATDILGLLFSVILIFVLSILIKFLAKFLNKIFSFSIVGKLNKLLGGIAGSVKGVIYAIIFCTVISLILSFTGKPFFIFSQENINNSYLFKLLTELIPF